MARGSPQAHHRCVRGDGTLGRRRVRAAPALAKDRNIVTIRTFGRLRADSAIWLGIAAVLFCLSAFLTLAITSVKRNPVTFVLLFSGQESVSPAGPRPTVAFEAEGRDLVLVIAGIPHELAEIEFGPLSVRSASDVSCSEVDLATVSAYGSPTVPGRLATYPPDARFNVRAPFANPASYRISVAELQRAYPYKPRLSEYELNTPRTPRTIQCRFPTVVLHDTFTSRSLEIVVTSGTKFNQRTGNLEASYILPGRVSASDEDADEIRVTNQATGQTLLGESMSLPPATGSPAGADAAATGLKFRWNSISAGELRDIIIVVIGTLIALGAAAAIEGGRPYIEALVRERETERQ